MVLRVGGEEEDRNERRRSDRQQVRLTRKYRRKKDRQLVSFLHKSKAEGAQPSQDELPILKQ